MALEAIGTVSAISQLLGVAGKFFELYDEFRKAGLVHASNQAAIGGLSQVSSPFELAMGHLKANSGLRRSDSRSVALNM